jgi:hypothetical protein
MIIHEIQVFLLFPRTRGVQSFLAKPVAYVPSGCERMRFQWYDAWDVCRTSVMNSAMNRVMGYQWKIVCGNGIDCNISKSIACGGHLAAINDLQV